MFQESRQILVDVVYSNISDLLMELPGKNRPVILCRDCFAFSKKKIFSEGYNEVNFIAVLENNLNVSKQISFIVDSRDPKITNYRQKDRLSNGNFSLSFMEENPSELSITLGNSLSGFQTIPISLQSCIKVRTRTECNFLIDISHLDGQEIDYNFTIIDILNKTDNSRTNSILVDTSAPILNSVEYDLRRRIATLTLNITENNLDRVKMTDSTSEKNTTRTLCTRLNKNICDKRVSLARGNHSISFEIIDNLNHRTIAEGPMIEIK